MPPDTPTEIQLPSILVPLTAMPRSAFGRWIRGGAAQHDSHAEDHTHPWHRVLWLTGVDYFLNSE